jgi:hypothetical protein
MREARLSAHERSFPDAWQKPKDLVEKLSIVPGTLVADIPDSRQCDGSASTEPIDLVFSCETYHHMTDRVAYFTSLAHSLTADGRVAILAEDVRREMEAAGCRRIADFDLVESQHFQIFSPTGS